MNIDHCLTPDIVHFSLRKFGVDEIYNVITVIIRASVSISSDEYSSLFQLSNLHMYVLGIRM